MPWPYKILRTSITTQGSDSHGIFAQSVGGGGGDGGFSIADTSGIVGNVTNFLWL